MSPNPNPLERQYLGADELDGWRHRLYVVIFESDTVWGRAFDVALIGTILLSVLAVMLESVAPIRAEYGSLLYAAEWGFTLLFTVEYVLRLVCVGRPARYAFSFFGLVDLIAVVPTYFSILIPEAQFLLVIRLLRILRVFRVLKLVHYMSEADVLLAALRASRRKITIFLFAVGSLVVILGSMMYMIEGAGNGFTSIPVGIYWAVVTLTTVGYGDISPQTAPGQTLAAIIMIIGYAIIAVPTGIFAAEMSRTVPTRPGGDEGESEGTPSGGPRGDGLREGRAGRARSPSAECPSCGVPGHPPDALFCRRCGTELGPF